ncbi:NAD(P)-dependent glycerol-3-phosphate dehydrogenase [bacterium]|nr:NAD(P)-dependent glycerol-3-phosphate dehydrogenase [FCB group bacterium]MBL7190759.1 NAD(P)-dependent glycerol-3-phosphate dehydrogenase [bacterium]
MDIGVIGAGSWGTTLSLLLHSNGHRLTLYEFRPEIAKAMEKRRENFEFLPGIELPEELRVTSDLAETVDGKRIILIAVPTHVLRGVISKIDGETVKDAVIVSATKGIESGTLLRISEIIKSVWSQVPESKIAALSGPSLAGEALKRIPTTVVSACSSIQTAQWVQRVFYTPRFRIYASEDIIGVELGGALKNVIAIAAGISDGLGFGDNSKGALLTRGLAEIKRLGVKMGGQEATFAGLSGMGDLITTCVSRMSRNHTVGEKIGRGMKLKEILQEMIMVAEGINTARAASELSRKYEVPMPIVDAIYSILFEDKDPLTAVGELMERQLKVED